MSNQSKSPTHVAYSVRKGKGKNFWTRIGAAWQHQDGQGFNIQLDSFPIDGSVTLRSAAEKPSEETVASAEAA